MSRITFRPGWAYVKKKGHVAEESASQESRLRHVVGIESKLNDCWPEAEARPGS